VMPPGIERFQTSRAHRSLGIRLQGILRWMQHCPGHRNCHYRFGSCNSKRLEQASSVAPVVITSSTSKTRKLSTWVPGRVAKAPRTDSQRSREPEDVLVWTRAGASQQDGTITPAKPNSHSHSKQLGLVIAALAKPPRDQGVLVPRSSLHSFGKAIGEPLCQQLPAFKLQRHDRPDECLLVSSIASGAHEGVRARCTDGTNSFVRHRTAFRLFGVGSPKASCDRLAVPSDQSLPVTYR
jgi:hypothetical protein